MSILGYPLPHSAWGWGCLKIDTVLNISGKESNEKATAKLQFIAFYWAMLYNTDGDYNLCTDWQLHLPLWLGQVNQEIKRKTGSFENMCGINLVDWIGEQFLDSYLYCSLKDHRKVQPWRVVLGDQNYEWWIDYKEKSQNALMVTIFSTPSILKDIPIHSIILSTSLLQIKLLNYIAEWYLERKYDLLFINSIIIQGCVVEAAVRKS